MPSKTQPLCIWRSGASHTVCGEPITQHKQYMCYAKAAAYKGELCEKCRTKAKVLPISKGGA